MSFWVGILIYHYKILFKPGPLDHCIEPTMKLLDLERLSQKERENIEKAAHSLTSAWWRISEEGKHKISYHKTHQISSRISKNTSNASRSRENEKCQGQRENIKNYQRERKIAFKETAIILAVVFNKEEWIWEENRVNCPCAEVN